MNSGHIYQVLSLEISYLCPGEAPVGLVDELDGVLHVGEHVDAGLDAAVAALAEDVARQVVRVLEARHAHALAQPLLLATLRLELLRRRRHLRRLQPDVRRVGEIVQNSYRLHISILPFITKLSLSLTKITKKVMIALLETE